MEITRETVLEWLKQKGRKPTWLAKECDVTKQAVSNWLREKNFQPISAEAKIKIRILMQEDAVAAESKPPHNLVLEFSDQEYSLIERAALKNKTTVRNWAKDILNSAADLDVEEFAAAEKSRNPVKYPAQLRRISLNEEAEPKKPHPRGA